MKRILSILLALLLLVACGAKEKSSRPEPEGSPSSVPGSAPGPETPPDSEPGPQRNQAVEALLRDFNSPPQGGPALVLGKPTGLVLMYDRKGDSDGRVQVPIPSSGPGLDQANGASLRNDAVVIAYGPLDNSDTVSILSTADLGQSWQSSSIQVKDAGKYNYILPAFRDADNGVLVLCQRTNDNEPIYAEDTGLIFATQDRGMTWSGPAYFPVMDVFYGVTATEGGYCIAGGIGSDPVVLHSGDGVSWDQATLPLDTEEYPEGYCRYAAFSGDTGLAAVNGIKADGKKRLLYFFTEDNGQSWSPYETG